MSRSQNPTRRRNVGISFGKRELRDLAVAWVALSVAFALLTSGPNRFVSLAPSEMVATLLFTGLTAGIGFLLHELAHKFAAIHFGYPAEFRADYQMLLLAIFSAMVGFLFAAPGAVYHPKTGPRESGLIALAGPATNVVLTVVFLPLAFVGGVVGAIGVYGVFINAFLAGFNMIPYGPLDGRKVLRWSKPGFVVSFAVCGGLALAALFGPLPTPF
ncbi:metalloprotease [Haloarchaeobius sp. DFWS5]|uniref:metalloprotease n=1 Tax=Haloarchaeobius sp. DFWS5 TaxID=3446114 RepID=UPI003EBA057B